jgi:hypothetical protein
MAYDLQLADRISNLLEQKGVLFEAKKMMGGWCAMVDNKMCVGIVKNQLMARIGPDIYEKALTRPFCGEMNFTGRSMKGYVFVEPEGIDSANDLEYYVDLCLAFNPLAKASKKKKKKKKG